MWPYTCCIKMKRYFLQCCVSLGIKERKRCLMLLGFVGLIPFFNIISQMSADHTVIHSPVANVYSSTNGSITSMEFAKALDIPMIKVPEADCAKLFDNNITDLYQLTMEHVDIQSVITDNMYSSILPTSCSMFIKDRQYLMKPVSEEEANFPIAFSIVMHKEVDLFERLLRAIYRPQNYYCVHVDKKTRPAVLSAVQFITECFDNVFISSRRYNIKWGTFSVLAADLECMKNLWKFNAWKYLINLTGQEFPLKTNLDLVRILKAFNGTNNIDGTVQRRNVNRTAYTFKQGFITNQRKPPPPVNITLTKGSLHVAVSRAYVDYILHDSRALAFRDWLNDTGIPDETFFSSLHHSPQLEVPGAYLGKPESNTETYPFFARFKIWMPKRFLWPCKGKWVRTICVFGVGDLPLLSQRPELFANKFNMDFEPLALSCLEQLHFNRTRDEILGTRDFDAQMYAKYDFVWNHL